MSDVIYRRLLGLLGIGHEKSPCTTRCISTSVFPETGPHKSLVAGGNHTLRVPPSQPDGAVGITSQLAGSSRYLCRLRVRYSLAVRDQRRAWPGRQSRAWHTRSPSWTTARCGDGCRQEGAAWTSNGEDCRYTALRADGYAVAAAGCGRARHAMLGGKGRFRLEEDTPEQGEMRGWRQVGAAWGSVLVLKADGTVKGWGRNDKGQLPPKGLQGVQEMAVGSEHGLAVVGGKVVTWGWGEHGNCGLDRSQNGGDVIGGVHVVEVHGTAKR
ncbi:hypothetical protein BZA05DRAFT_413549, partial [Tricharina praecox]|uniref:uncharacterized protein n=1 Tax=Tricharina praecox TaxID=43433 RepID=UPI00222087ED